MQAFNLKVAAYWKWSVWQKHIKLNFDSKDDSLYKRKRLYLNTDDAHAYASAKISKWSIKSFLISHCCRSSHWEAFSNIVILRLWRSNSKLLKNNVKFLKNTCEGTPCLHSQVISRISPRLCTIREKLFKKFITITYVNILLYSLLTIFCLLTLFKYDIIYKSYPDSDPDPQKTGS